MSLRGSEGFPSPFFDYASMQMPDSHATVLKLAEFIMESNATYRSAMDRINSYFLTDIDIGSPSTKRVGSDERDKYKTFLSETLDIMQVLKSCGSDFDCYGNFFTSLIIPFRRFLDCPKCRSRFSFKEVSENNEFKFKWKNFQFTAVCPRCGGSGAWLVHDEPDKDESRIRVKRWSPHEMDILYDPYSDDCRYLWRISEDYKNDIRTGKMFQIERASLEVISAIKNNQMFLFSPEVIFHGKEPCLAGRRNRGWGISRVLTNFRQVWYVQVLHRYNEAIALDYVIPFRLITPAPRGGSSVNAGQAIDPLLSSNMGDFSAQVRRMITKRRHNPTGWHTLPFPVQYQALGGDATQLAPRELMDQGMETLLNALGTPVEMYRGTLSMQAAPVALRLFESNHHHRVHNNNAFLSWLVNQISRTMSWEQVTAKMRSVTYADDANKQMMLLQLMMGGAVSSTTGLRALGIGWKDEQRQLAEEARFQQETQAELQEEMQTQAFGQEVAKGQPASGQPQPGGQPTQGDPNAAAQPGPVTQYLQSLSPSTPITPQDMMATADSLAQELLGMPSSQRIGELRALKAKNEALHGLVKAKLEQIRSQARSAGGAQVMSQTFGQQ